MARKSITEFRAKTILLHRLKLPYSGISVNDQAKVSLPQNKKYILKVDDGVKKRMKKGLIALDLTPKMVLKFWSRLKKQGYKKFLIEEFVPHKQEEEKFLSIERTRGGLSVYYSRKGGVDIEENQSDVQNDILDDNNIHRIANSLGIPKNILETIRESFGKFYFSFLEINPLVVSNGNLYFLDLAVEVDTAGVFYVQNAWTEQDFTNGSTRVKTEEEKAVENLSSKSQSSLKLDVLNPNGSIFMVLSGGGASLVLADEVYNLGYGEKLANYGEYSGNPNEDETYIYTKNILSLLLKSKAKKKVLIIGGGVANFTDIRITFNGIIKALTDVKAKLRSQNVKVFVRRGGPRQKEALQSIKVFLEKEKLYGSVSGPNMMLTEIVKRAVAAL